MEKRYERVSIIEKFQSISFLTQYKSNLMQSFEILYWWRARFKICICRRF